MIISTIQLRYIGVYSSFRHSQYQYISMNLTWETSSNGWYSITWSDYQRLYGDKDPGLPAIFMSTGLRGIWPTAIHTYIQIIYSIYTIYTIYIYIHKYIHTQIFEARAVSWCTPNGGSAVLARCAFTWTRWMRSTMNRSRKPRAATLRWLLKGESIGKMVVLPEETIRKPLENHRKL